VFAAVPVRVEYELTPLGHSLPPVMRAVKDWAQAHMDEVLLARAGFDTAAEREG
jgi:DNA-binding HxlR family transcriptional regulator